MKTPKDARKELDAAVRAKHVKLKEDEVKNLAVDDKWFIAARPEITMEQLAKQLGITRKGVEWQMRELKKVGKVERLGPTKGGSGESFGRPVSRILLSQKAEGGRPKTRPKSQLTIPDKPRSRQQKYRLTGKGQRLLAATGFGGTEL